MKKIVLLLFVLLSMSLSGQIIYEAGYFINNNNEKIDCLIKNSDWVNNPEEFVYKLSEESEPINAFISEVLEFKILNTDHYYKRFLLKNDITNRQIGIIKKANEFIFLLVLLESNASLFSYHNEGMFMFYNVDEQINLLEYEKYVDNESKIQENNEFKKQLFKDLKCETFNINKFRRLRYVEGDLVRLFEDYNKCAGSEVINLYKKRTSFLFDFKLNLGLNLISPNETKFGFKYGYIPPPSSGTDYIEKSEDEVVTFDSQTSFSFGIEAELFLPLQRNKWSVFTAPNYQYYSKSSSSGSFSDPNVNLFVNLDYTLEYSYLEIPFGVRHYFNLNDRLRLFGNFAYAHNVIISSKQEDNLEFSGNTPSDFTFEQQKVKSEDITNSSLIVGFGGNFKQKYSFAVNYYIMKNFNISEFYQSNTNGTLSFVVSYVMF